MIKNEFCYKPVDETKMNNKIPKTAQKVLESRFFQEFDKAAD